MLECVQHQFQFKLYDVSGYDFDEQIKLGGYVVKESVMWSTLRFLF